MARQTGDNKGGIGAGRGRDLRHWRDVPLKLSAVLGTTSLTARHLLNLQAGEELELEGRSDGQVDIFTQDRLVARGKLVKTKDGIGVQVLEVLPLDAIKNPR